jgi:mannose-6-phosphate isomerase
MLYPIKFNSLLFKKIWGGTKLQTFCHKDIKKADNIGESWEISSVEGNISVVKNGFLKGNMLDEIIEIYMADIVGERVYERFGNEFPLLVKFIDANDTLSIQVHPDDNLAKQRHHAFGKTEMWYVLHAEKDAFIISGFNKNVTKEEYLDYVNKGKVEELLNKVPAKQGDVFFIPAGRVHAIGKGVLLAEIQQTSDVTYRIYDWNRADKNGDFRELHTDLALDAIDFSHTVDIKTDYKKVLNETASVISCPYFKTNVIKSDTPLERNYELLDSFVILMVLDGEGTLEYAEGKETYKTGETILIPAEMELLTIHPNPISTILEIYIP